MLSSLPAQRSVILTSSFLLFALLSQGQTGDYKAPRFPGSQYPDLNGIWQAVNSANWDLEAHTAGPSPFPSLLGAYAAEPAGQSVVVGGKIPYRPEALAKRAENFKNRLARPKDRATNDSTGDPEAKCYLPGIPRATYMPYPFRIVQAPKQVLMSYEFASAARIVFMDHKPRIPNEAWMGWSVGHFEGDTLVVEVTDQTDRTWLDRAGNFHSAALKVTERYTPISPYHLRYEATLEDPKVFSQPWTIRMILYRRVEDNAQLLEFKCVEFAEEFIYGHLVEKTGK